MLRQPAGFRAFPHARSRPARPVFEVVLSLSLPPSLCECSIQCTLALCDAAEKCGLFHTNLRLTLYGSRLAILQISRERAIRIEMVAARSRGRDAYGCTT